MINVNVEDATDTYSKTCVISLQLFTCFFSLSWIIKFCLLNKKKVKWICNYFMFKYTKASLLKVVSSTCLSLSKIAASLVKSSPMVHHRTYAWNHGCSNSCEKLFFRTGSAHFAKVRHKCVWMDWETILLGNQLMIILYNDILHLEMNIGLGYEKCKYDINREVFC